MALLGTATLLPTLGRSEWQKWRQQDWPARQPFRLWLATAASHSRSTTLGEEGVAASTPGGLPAAAAPVTPGGASKGSEAMEWGWALGNAAGRPPVSACSEQQKPLGGSGELWSLPSGWGSRDNLLPQIL